MPEILLGNTSVVVAPGGTQVFEHAEGDPAPDVDAGGVIALPELGNQITTVAPPEGTSAQECVQIVNHIWPLHSDAGPEWVECDEDVGIATAVAAYFTSAGNPCKVGRPKGWKEGS